MVFFAILFSCKNNKKNEEINNIEKETSNENNMVVIEKSYEDDISTKIKYVNSPKGLNLRSAADINSDKIMTVPNKSVVKIVDIDKNLIIIDDIQNNWYFINYNGTTGWLFGGYLSDNLPLDLPVIIGTWININHSGIQFRFNSDYTYELFEVNGFYGGNWRLSNNMLTLEENYREGSDGGGLKMVEKDTEYYNISITIIDRDNITFNFDQVEYISYNFKEEIVLKRTPHFLWFDY
jgi:hypothetical protein